MLVLTDDNANANKRIIAFLIDSFFASILRVFLQLLFIPLSLQRQYKSALHKFTEMFPQLEPRNVSSVHINYILTTPIYSVFLRGIMLFTFTGIVYNIIAYLCFSKTLGQKLLSLKVVNFNSSETKVSKIKYILKAILTPFPMICIGHSILYMALFLFNFHMLIPADKISLKIIAFFVRFASPFAVATMIVFFFLFWYCLYFITNRLILVDILTMTKVVDVKKTKEYLMNSDSKGFVIEFGDKVIKKMEALNIYISNLNSKCFTKIKNIFKRKK